MTHPLANDPTVPSILRKAFAKVRFQILRTYENGYEWSYNLNPAQDNHRKDILAKEQARLGAKDPINGKLVSVKLVEVA